MTPVLPMAWQHTLHTFFLAFFSYKHLRGICLDWLDLEVLVIMLFLDSGSMYKLIGSVRKDALGEGL